jgi:hypothetical protein
MGNPKSCMPKSKNISNPHICIRIIDNHNSRKSICASSRHGNKLRKAIPQVFCMAKYILKA